MRLYRGLVLILSPGLAFGEVSFHARYRAAGNAFQILDCVSGWWEDYCGDHGAYRKDWDKRAGLNDADNELFKKYGELRSKYYPGEDQEQKDPLKNRDGFFTELEGLSADPIAPAFYDSDSVETALKRLAATVSQDDSRFLAGFYSRFHDRLRSYLEESVPFVEAAALLDKKLQNPEYADFFRGVQKFYGVNATVAYVALYVWWPPLDRDYAYPAGDRLILSKNPAKHLSWPDEETVFHEIVHTLSARQPPDQKRKLTKTFLEICDIRSKERTNKILEEPLAVAIGQMLFLKRFDPKRFAQEKSWYNDPWIHRFAPALFPIVEQAFAQGRHLDADFVRKAAGICKSMQ